MVFKVYQFWQVCPWHISPLLLYTHCYLLVIKNKSVLNTATGGSRPNYWHAVVCYCAFLRIYSWKKKRFRNDEHGGIVGSAAISQLWDLWFDPELGLLSIWSFACSPCICVGCLSVLWFPLSSQKHASWWNGNSKLHLGVSGHANANVCMFPYDGFASNPGAIPDLNGYWQWMNEKLEMLKPCGRKQAIFWCLSLNGASPANIKASLSSVFSTLLKLWL